MAYVLHLVKEGRIILLIRNTKTAEHLFGRAASIYLPLINEIAEELLRADYAFMPTEEFREGALNGKISQAEQGKIFWIETIQRAHLVSVLAIIRTTRWIEACSREYDAVALASFAACCRALIESVGDAADALNYAALTLAELASDISNEVNGSGVGAMSSELEERLIHFTHARKISKGDPAPVYHKAKRTADYVDIVAKMGLPRAEIFYATLCELMHPAAGGMSDLYVGGSGAFKLSVSGEKDALAKLIDDNRSTFNEMLPLALNPALLTLRVTCAFGVARTPRPLKALNFSNIVIWKRIEAGMRKAGLSV